MTWVTIVVIAIISVVLLAGAICVVTKAGSKEGICKYPNQNNNNEQEETNND